MITGGTTACLPIQTSSSLSGSYSSSDDLLVKEGRQEGRRGYAVLVVLTKDVDHACILIRICISVCSGSVRRCALDTSRPPESAGWTLQFEIYNQFTNQMAPKYWFVIDITYFPRDFWFTSFRLIGSIWTNKITSDGSEWEIAMLLPILGQCDMVYQAIPIHVG